MCSVHVVMVSGVRCVSVHTLSVLKWCRDVVQWWHGPVAAPPSVVLVVTTTHVHLADSTASHHCTAQHNTKTRQEGTR